jgi:hypothetical protein
VLVLIGIVSLCQSLLALAAIIAIWPPDSQEAVPIVMSFAGAVLSLLLAIGENFDRRPVLLAVALHSLAIGVFCLLPLIVGGESQEGLAFLIGTGLIVLVTGPPAFNSVLPLRCIVSGQ